MLLQLYLQSEVKFHDHVIIQKTPVIILSNNDKLFDVNEKCWADRILHLKCKSAPFVRRIQRRLHPLCWLKIFEHYKFL